MLRGRRLGLGHERGCVGPVLVDHKFHSHSVTRLCAPVSSLAVTTMESRSDPRRTEFRSGIASTPALWSVCWLWAALAVVSCRGGQALSPDEGNPVPVTSATTIEEARAEAWRGLAHRRPRSNVTVQHETRIQWLQEQIEARGKRRRVLLEEAGRSPGWSLHESEHYFILTDVEDLPWLEEVKLCVEGLRTELVANYPPNTPLGGPNLPTMTCLRIFERQTGFQEYGGSFGGTLRARHGEMTCCADRSSNSATEFWNQLRQLVLMEYLVVGLQLNDPKPPLWVLYGLAARHGWRARRPHGHSRSTSFDLRMAKVLEWREASKWWSLEDLLAFPCDRHSLDSALVHEAWAFVHFLSEASEEAVYWDPAWELIIWRYLESATSGDPPGLARQKAFAKVDKLVLEAVWLHWIDGHRQEPE